jgi:acyl-CoA thioesterase
MYGGQAAAQALAATTLRGQDGTLVASVAQEALVHVPRDQA